MPVFETLQTNDDLKEILKSAFDSDLAVDGSWGYTQETVTYIEPSNIPTPQIEHIFASMRSYLEMNMTLKKDERYSGINVNELSRETLTLNNIKYHKVLYEVTAMKEATYTAFSKDYKENYGKKEFDLTEHFLKRKQETLRREVLHWFQV